MNEMAKNINSEHVLGNEIRFIVKCMKYYCCLVGKKYMNCRSTFQNNANNNQQLGDMTITASVHLIFVDFTFGQKEIYARHVRKRTMDNQVVSMIILIEFIAVSAVHVLYHS